MNGSTVVNMNKRGTVWSPFATSAVNIRPIQDIFLGVHKFIIQLVGWKIDKHVLSL